LYIEIDCYIFGFLTNIQSNFEGTSTVQLKEVSSSCILKLTYIFGFLTNVQSNFEGTSTVQPKKVSSSSVSKLALVYKIFKKTNK